MSILLRLITKIRECPYRQHQWRQQSTSTYRKLYQSLTSFLLFAYTVNAYKAITVYNANACKCLAMQRGKRNLQLLLSFLNSSFVTGSEIDKLTLVLQLSFAHFSTLICPSLSSELGQELVFEKVFRIIFFDFWGEKYEKTAEMGNEVFTFQL